jgi:hypothetical protein
VKVAGAHAHYASTSCTASSAGADSGDYEWDPWPVGDAHFEGGFGKLVFVGKSGTLLECAAGSASGEYTGSQSATISLVLTGCKFVLAGVACQGSGAAAGEVTVDALPAQLGFIADASKPSLGWALNAPVGSTFASFECDGYPFSLSGSVIAALSTADKMSKTAKLTFKASKGIQVPTHFEGGPEDVLELVYGAKEPVSLEATVTLENQEALELRAQE